MLRSRHWREGASKKSASRYWPKTSEVTKGGFYRAYSDRRALLNALLERWRVGPIAAIEAHTRRGGAGGSERLRELIRLYSEFVNPEGMAIPGGDGDPRRGWRSSLRSASGQERIAPPRWLSPTSMQRD
jgi:AcrR family transcriptional regulator